MSSSKKNILVALLAGHGKISTNRMIHHEGYEMHTGDIFYEGWSNRTRLEATQNNLRDLQIPFVTLSAPIADTSLKIRARLANLYSDFYDAIILIDLHSNAGGGNGAEAWTYIGQSNADVVAEYLIDYTKDLTDVRIRADYTDGDSDKEAKFYILKHTNEKVYSVIWEYRFHDDPVQAELLLDDEEIHIESHIITLAILASIQRFNT
jgi:N-acetylmuramoyl-L-alanine amidase